jgi:hypothetical protein
LPESLRWLAKHSYLVLERIVVPSEQQLNEIAVGTEFVQNTAECLFIHGGREVAAEDYLG